MSNITIRPNLWFSDNAEEAVNFYISIFPNSRIERITRYGKAGYEIHKQPEGTVMTIDFVLDRQKFVALNGGPYFRFNEAISFVVSCETQEEIDHYWEKLGAGGDPAAQQCGWLKDKYGLSWQVVPAMLEGLMSELPSERSEKAMEAVLRMKKLSIPDLKRAAGM